MPESVGSGSSFSVTLSSQGKTLLSLLESSRDLLARKIVCEYPAVAEPELNGAVHSSLFRLLFLAAGEHYGFSEPGTLRLLAESSGIGKRLTRACQDAGLPRGFLENDGTSFGSYPEIPDDGLREIVVNAGSPDFPGMPTIAAPEELAVVFEYFLATRLSAGEGYRVVNVPKSAVLYTGSVDIPDPQSIQSIVNGTLAPVLQAAAGRSQPIYILDPACGAGIFLLASYRFLTKKKVHPLIPLQSVFGTDIDRESVSAARLVLLLASIGEKKESGNGSAIVSPEEVRRTATDLFRSIRCGNALIAPDYFSGRQVHPFNADERRRINAFSWEDTFPEIIRGGGFDAIIGAPPPYQPFAVRSREEYFQMHYAAYAPEAGLYGYFIERSLSLLRTGGRICFLVPEQFLRSENARPLRRLLLTGRILRIEETGMIRPLQNGPVRMYVLTVANRQPGKTSGIELWKAGRRVVIDQQSLSDGGWILSDGRSKKIAERLSASGMPLERYVMGEIRFGSSPGMPKIIADSCSNVPVFRYDRYGSCAPTTTIIAIERDDPYLAGILNSSLGRFLIARICPVTDPGPRLSPACLGKFPVIVPDFDNLADKVRHNRVVELVIQILSLRDYQQKAKTDQERRLVQQEIEATDVKIDALVYELYGLTPDEIAVVEESK